MIINLTPHTINVRLADGSELAFVPTAPAARVATTREVVGEVNGIPICRTTYGQVENLPEQKEGTMYVVSLLVLQVAPERRDLVAPDSGPSAIREGGQVKAVTGFVTL
ncbi:MAG: hypothetical protein NTV02_02220 [Candidatus Zambryskibacteria bacterium]|nr:hypothetical protein [Candidatus Zambryskibacteria bacterium]